MRRLRNIGRLFTGTAAGVIEGAAVICDGEQIAWCGKHGDEPRELLESVNEEDDCANGLVTAGLIDAHTHPVYAGDRMREVAMRSAGASYEEVAKASGGIKATVKATREEPISALEQATARRLWSWLGGGGTTGGGQNGYHLQPDGGPDRDLGGSPGARHRGRDDGAAALVHGPPRLRRRCRAARRARAGGGAPGRPGGQFRDHGRGRRRHRGRRRLGRRAFRDPAL